MKNYFYNYSKSIYEGLNNSIFMYLNKEISSENFINELIKKTDNIKKNAARLFFIGNGASCAFANHMALDWSKNGGILSLSLSDSSLLTALSNDYSYETAFVEFLKINKINNDDLVVTISSSGNSPNIVNVLNYCKENNFNSFSLSGLKKNNESSKKAKYSIYVPSKTYGIVECIHQVLLHMWLDRSMNVKEWSRDYYQDMNSDNFTI